MLSVREARNFRGSGPISLVALANLERRSFPVSVRDMVTVEQRDYSGSLTAGDVSCTYKVTLYNSGAWHVSADFHDDGDIAGDSFLLDLVLDEAHGIGTSLTGDLGPGDTTTLGNKGIDPWIRDNWAALHTTPVKAHLHAQADVLEAILSVIGTALLIGAAAYVFGGSHGVEARQCEAQGLDNHDQCVEFVRRSE